MTKCDGCLFCVQTEHEELQRYKKAVDKACKFLEQVCDCVNGYRDGSLNQCPMHKKCNKKPMGSELCTLSDWKGWLLEDESI